MKRLWVHKHAYTTGISCFKMPHFVSRVSFDNLFHQWRTITTRCAACSVTRKKKQTADNWNGVNWEAVECESKCKKSKKNIYVLQYDNYSANGKKCGEKKRVWCVNIKWDDIADLLLQVVFFPLSWSALKDSTQQEKKKKHNIGIHYLNDIVLPWSATHFTWAIIWRVVLRSSLPLRRTLGVTHCSTCISHTSLFLRSNFCTRSNDPITLSLTLSLCIFFLFPLYLALDV